jgi:hypothetical protein
MFVYALLFNTAFLCAIHRVKGFISPLIAEKLLYVNRRKDPQSPIQTPSEKLTTRPDSTTRTTTSRCPGFFRECNSCLISAQFRHLLIPGIFIGFQAFYFPG